MGSRQQLAKSFDFCSVDLPMRGGCFCGRNGFLGQFRRSAQERSQSHHGFRLYRRMRDGDVGLLNAKRDENWKMTVIYGIGVAGAVALTKALFAMFGGAASSAVTGF
jgi:hypothetical protein